jgi:hypothetical protein
LNAELAPPPYEAVLPMGNAAALCMASLEVTGGRCVENAATVVMSN